MMKTNMPPAGRLHRLAVAIAARSRSCLGMLKAWLLSSEIRIPSNCDDAEVIFLALLLYSHDLRAGLMEQVEEDFDPALRAGLRAKWQSREEACLRMAAMFNPRAAAGTLAFFLCLLLSGCQAARQGPLARWWSSCGQPPSVNAPRQAAPQTYPPQPNRQQQLAQQQADCTARLAQQRDAYERELANLRADSEAWARYQLNGDPEKQTLADQVRGLADTVRAKHGENLTLKGRLDDALGELAQLHEKLAQRLPQVDPAPAVDAAGAVIDAVKQGTPIGAALEQGAEHAGQAWLTTLLVGLGLPMGPAGVAAGLAAAAIAGGGAMLVRSRGKKLRAQLDQLQAKLAAHTGGPAGSAPVPFPKAPPGATSDSAASGDGSRPAAPAAAAASEPIIETQIIHNAQMVPYETNLRDRAWRDAVAKVANRYPESAAWLTLVQKARDDIVAAEPNPRGEIHGK